MAQQASAASKTHATPKEHGLSLPTGERVVVV